MKKVLADGHVIYTYYKKKVGRKKKRGPKKKKQLRGRRWQETWDYKIVHCVNRKQIDYIGAYRTLEEVEYVRQQLENENDKIIFPVKFINSGILKPYNEEYVILRNDSGAQSQLRNEYGKYIAINTNSEKWSVYDRFPRQREETFWVYGLNPKSERKTFAWIYDNLCKEMITPTGFIRIYLYNNKIIFQYDDDFNMVICKNISDAIRFYNLIENDKDKSKNIILCGMTHGHADRTNEVFGMIKIKTGWGDSKIYRTTTRS